MDHLELMAEAASKGPGIAYVPDSVAEPWLKRGELCVVLTEWSPVYPGLALYYPGHRHVPAALRAFIDLLKEQAAAKPGAAGTREGAR